ncbi:hypothetical protein BTVI_70171 [Pitangus sulphuratus]|nr:hypothetical protein BTVI_70171 [Pitangus sulphuratus]
MVAEPSAQDLVTAKATPAEAMAWTKADSLVAAGERKQGMRDHTRGLISPVNISSLSRAWREARKLSSSLWSGLDLLQRGFSFTRKRAPAQAGPGLTQGR